ncbi:hypothetical protein ACH4MA_03660 [Streptomyces roseolus]
MLFALDAQGVPGTARFITVTDPAAGRRQNRMTAERRLWAA